MPMVDPTQRFSSRVASYVRYRPGYPVAVIELLRSQCGLQATDVVADIGSGTGLLTRLFLENGNRVYGVEPNPDMRVAGEEALASHTNFVSVNGRSEATTLPDHSVDFVVAAQAAHWFDRVPNDLVDWPATDKWTADRAKGVPMPGAAEVDKEYAAEKKAEEERTPHVAPGLRLPDDGGIALLDTFKGQPQLIALDQNGGELNKNTKSNMIRAAINPIASAKETIELRGTNAKVQAHVDVPSIYVNVEQQNQLDRELDAQQPEQPISKAKEVDHPDLPWDRFKLVRVEQKGGKRIVGNLKVAVYGKVSQETKLVPTIAQQLTGGWVKITPSAPLSSGEYAIVEYLGKEGVNLAVWDFGVNPSAPENQSAWKPDPTQFNSQDQKPVQLEQRQPH